MRRPRLAEHRCCLEATLDTDWQRSTRYWGAWLCRQLNMMRPIKQMIRQMAWPAPLTSHKACRIKQRRSCGKYQDDQMSSCCFTGFTGEPLWDGGGHVQGLADCNTSLPRPPHEDPTLCAESSIIWHSSAGSTFQENNSAACGFYHSSPTVWNSLPRKPRTDSL